MTQLNKVYLAKRIPVRNLYLKVDSNKKYSFAFLEMVKDPTTGHYSVQQLVNISTLSVVPHTDMKNYKHLLVQEKGTNLFLGNQIYYNTINYDISDVVSTYAYDKLETATSSMHEKCDPDKSISVKNLIKLETKLSVHDRLVQMSDERAAAAVIPSNNESTTYNAGISNTDDSVMY